MNAIHPSELIINERGAVYHLNLLPEELANTIITVGDPARVHEVSRNFNSIQYKRQHREFVTHTGFVGNKRVSVISTGIGTDNIDILMNEIDALANIDFASRTIKPKLISFNLFRIGTSGSLQEDIPVNSFVASTHGLGIDNLLNFYITDNNNEEKDILQQFTAHTQLHTLLSQPYITGASPFLLKRFTENFHHGITVTCPGFYGPQERILRLGLSMPNLISSLTKFQYGHHRITNFEMETSAIYGLGKLLKHNCISLSVIVANRIRKEFSNSAEAMNKLIEYTLRVIEDI